MHVRMEGGNIIHKSTESDDMRYYCRSLVLEDLFESELAYLMLTKLQ